MSHFQTEQEKETQVNEWIRFGLRLAVSAALHPFEYSKVLIQLGYEPIAPYPGKDIFGRPILLSPNIFKYAAYILKTDGISGCYKGLAPKLFGSVFGSLCSERIADRIFNGTLPDDSKDDSDLTEDEQFTRFKFNLKRDLVIHASGIIVTHPFHVISLRMMAQFIGRETAYRSILGSIFEIYKHDGIKGFFYGIIPKLLCDLACVSLTSFTVYMLNKHLIRDKDGRQYSASFTQFVFSSLLYPLQVVSTCVVVSGSGLAAGKPPIMPEYNSWTDCWNDLQSRGELKRGNSLFWRCAKNPLISTKYNYAPLPTVEKIN